MGRPSKLTPAQWGEVERRLLAGETARSLGKVFGVSETAIRKKFGAHQNVSLQSSQVRTVAVQIAAAQTALESLPVAQRGVAISLADRLRGITEDLAGAAGYGAANAHRLHAMASVQVAKMDAENPEVSIETLKGVVALTRAANEAAAPGLALMAATKAAMGAGGDDGADVPHVIELVAPAG